MEKQIKAKSGWAMLGLALLLVISTVFSFYQLANSGGEDTKFIFLGSGLILVFFVVVSGFIAVEPNSARVLTLFGKYVGTVVESGFFWVNPFYTKKKISLRANNLDTKPIKVNDKLGNPIMIGAVVVWKVENAYKAAFEVDNYHSFVETQSEAAIRKLAGAFAYDNFDHDQQEITLRTSSTDVNEMLEREVSERLAIAGVYIIEARISHLAYSTEIAGAMLQRQQATAIVAARSKIVEGAVGMVEMALDELSRKQIVNLDEDKKAAMVSNLLVVLCSERGTTPVVNTGSLYQ